MYVCVCVCVCLCVCVCVLTVECEGDGVHEPEDEVSWCVWSIIAKGIPQPVWCRS